MVRWRDMRPLTDEECWSRIVPIACKEPVVWNGAEWVCALGHTIRPGSISEDWQITHARYQHTVGPGLEFRDIKAAVDNWYHEQTALWRLPAADNRPYGAIRAKVNRWHEERRRPRFGVSPKNGGSE